ncbi:sarcosine oxidase subunit delta [Pseudomaricurvus alkylphenolicus]|uniref:sarcosine oxidase subunit delta n=1 Tax=Pseudomaricurvus alkylphenolicus TaxID=1306991 RepID=UPI00142495A0|nr:sarcosine oxidase subunit delta [Pseudomaricurvus alkylphenolicus]NIB42505.1 sarcosine oxidase subunit delta [Pseudomaricurvus alkylphenolicus]
MKIMHCPLNGPRNISEFVHGGEVKAMPDPANCTDHDWADYVFYTDNKAGVVVEWWLHAPSSYWFIAERHTVTDDIIRTYDPSEVFKQRVEFSTESDVSTEAGQMKLKGVGA